MIHHRLDQQQNPGTGVWDYECSITVPSFPRYSLRHQSTGGITYSVVSLAAARRLAYHRASAAELEVIDAAFPITNPVAAILPQSTGFTFADPMSAKEASVAFVGIVSGVLKVYVRSADLGEPALYVTGWDNELGATTSDLILVYSPVAGPVVFVRTVSGLYMKNLWDGDPSARAVLLGSEVPGANWSRSAVLANEDGSVTVYVESATDDFIGTVCFSYDVGGQYSLGGPWAPISYSVGRHVSRPIPFLTSSFPVVAGRNWHSGLAGVVLRRDGDIVVCTTDSRGSVPLSTNVTTLSDVLGARRRNAHPDADVAVYAVGGCGPSILVDAAVILGLPSSPAFVALYGVTDGTDLVRRPFGIEYADPEFQETQVPLVTSSPAGYDLGVDPYLATCVIRMRDPYGDTAIPDEGTYAVYTATLATYMPTGAGQRFWSTTSCMRLYDPSACNQPYVTFAAWILVDAASPTGAIVTRDGVLSPSFRLWWDAGVLKVTYRLISSGTRTFSANMTTFPTGVPVYVTFKYDGTVARVFAFTWLIGEDVPPVGGPMYSDVTVLMVGDSTDTSTPLAGWKGAMADFVWGGAEALDDYKVVKAFFTSVSTDDGPCLLSRSAGYDRHDAVVSTSSTSIPGAVRLVVVTASLRFVSPSTSSSFSSMMSVDVWTTTSDGVTRFQGSIGLPPSITSYRGVLAPEEANTPVVYGRANATDIQVVPWGDTSHVYAVFAVDAVPSKCFIWGVKINPFTVSSTSIGAWDLVAVIDTSSEYVSALSCLPSPVAGEPTVVVALENIADPTRSKVYFVRPADFAAASPSAGTAGWYPTPSLVSGASFRADDPADFGVPPKSPEVTGLAVRRIAPFMGWHSDWTDAVQVLFSLGSVAGASGVDAAVLDNTVATYSIEISGASIDAGDQPLLVPANVSSVVPKQLDAYGIGGSVFVPVKFLWEGSSPQKDVYILGRAAPQKYFYPSSPSGPQVQGTTPLLLLRASREGVSDLVEVTQVPYNLRWDGNVRPGVSAAFLLDSDGLRTDKLVITRPYPSIVDAPVMYLTQAEVSDGGWAVVPTAALTPMSRAADALVSLAVTTYSVVDDAPAGMATIVSGDLDITVTPLRRGRPVKPLQGATFSRMWQSLFVWASGNTWDQPSPSPGTGPFLTLSTVSRGLYSGQVFSTEPQTGVLVKDSPADDEHAPVSIIECLGIGAVRALYAVYEAGRVAQIRELAFARDDLVPDDLVVWTPPLKLQLGVEHTMRAVSMSGVDGYDVNGITDFLYFAIVGDESSRIYVATVPPPNGWLPGDSFSRDLAPTFVCDVPARLVDRMYVHRHEDHVLLVVGSVDPAHGMWLMEHCPRTSATIRTLQTITGFSPYPRSLSASTLSAGRTLLLLDSGSGPRLTVSSRPSRSRAQASCNGAADPTVSVYSDGQLSVGAVVSFPCGIRYSRAYGPSLVPLLVAALLPPLSHDFFVDLSSWDSPVSPDFAVLLASREMEAGSEYDNHQHVFRFDDSALRPCRSNDPAIAGKASTAQPDFSTITAAGMQITGSGGVTTDAGLLKTLGAVESPKFYLTDQAAMFGWLGAPVPYTSPLDMTVVDYEAAQKIPPTNLSCGVRMFHMEPGVAVSITWRVNK